MFSFPKKWQDKNIIWHRDIAKSLHQEWLRKQTKNIKTACSWLCFTLYTKFLNSLYTIYWVSCKIQFHFMFQAERKLNLSGMRYSVKSSRGKRQSFHRIWQEPCLEKWTSNWKCDYMCFFIPGRACTKFDIETRTKDLVSS